MFRGGFSSINPYLKLLARYIFHIFIDIGRYLHLSSNIFKILEVYISVTHVLSNPRENLMKNTLKLHRNYISAHPMKLKSHHPPLESRQHPLESLHPPLKSLQHPLRSHSWKKLRARKKDCGAAVLIKSLCYFHPWSMASVVSQSALLW